MNKQTTRIEALQAANVLETVRLAIVEGPTTTQDLIDYQERRVDDGSRPL